MMMKYVEKVGQLSPRNIMTNAMTLMSNLGYILYQDRHGNGVQHLSEKKVLERDSKLSGRIEEYVGMFRGRNARQDSKVSGWWRTVSSMHVPQRELYICLPLQSPPIEPEDIELFKDRAPRFYKDALDITKKSMADTVAILEELGVAKHSYVVFIDDLYNLPAPVQPEKWSDSEQRVEAIPGQLQQYFEEHVCHSKLIFDRGRSVKRMKERIERKKLYNVPLKGHELELNNNEGEFKKKLSADIKLVKLMADLQLRSFWDIQTAGRELGEDCWIYMVGAVGDVGFYTESLSEVGWDANKYWIKPLEGVGDSNSRCEIVKDGLVASSRTMKKLKNIIQQTALREKPELVEDKQRTLFTFA